jgi:hypothetical protein
LVAEPVGEPGAKPAHLPDEDVGDHAREGHTMRRYRTLAAMTAGMMLLGSAALADNLRNDGDADAVGLQPLAFGDVCPGSVSQGEAEHWVSKQGGSSAHSTRFADGATVTFTVTETSSPALAAEMDDDPSTVVLPDEWRASENGDTSDEVSSTVTLTAPATEGPFAGTVTYNASAPFTTGTTSRTEGLAVTANVLAADHEACVEDEVVYTLQGFYAPVKGLDAVTIKGGSTLPLKFNLVDEDGNSVEDEAAKIDLTFSDCATNELGAAGEAVPTVAAAGDRQVRWDATAGQYIYNYKSPKGGGCKTVGISHDDADDIEFDGLTITLR